MRALLIQGDIKRGDPHHNREHFLNLMEQALKDEPDVLILPEMWNTGFYEGMKEQADRGGEPTSGILSRFAREHKVYVVGGSIADLEGDNLYNRSYVFSRQGEIMATYDKIHLFKLMKEDRTFNPGEKKSFFTLDDIPCGLIICYDLRFPELSLSLALAGAQVIIVVAQWPGSRIDAWRFLVGARAVENQIFTLGVNRAGREEGHTFGHSLAVDPAGILLGEAGEGETRLKVEISPEVIRENREKVFYHQDRKPHLY